MKPEDCKARFCYPPDDHHWNGCPDTCPLVVAKKERDALNKRVDELKRLLHEINIIHSNRLSKVEKERDALNKRGDNQEISIDMAVERLKEWEEEIAVMKKELFDIRLAAIGWCRAANGYDSTTKNLQKEIANLNKRVDEQQTELDRINGRRRLDSHP